MKDRGKIWVTRSEPGATQLAERIEAAGLKVWKAPVMRIEPLQPVVCERWTNITGEVGPGQQLPAGAIPDLPKPRLIIVLSVHGAMPYLRGCGIPRYADVQHIAIGRATARVLESLPVAVPAESTSEGILAMPQVANLGRGDELWIVAGEGGRTVLVDHFRRQLKLRIARFTTYRRVSVEVGLQRRDVRQIGMIVVGSAAGLSAVHAQWRLAGGQEFVKLLVPSQRVADKAAQLGFQRVYNTQGASADTVIAAITSMDGTA